MSADWIHIGSEPMRSAREAMGLSMEAASRQLHISTKTYDRREKDGRWPRHDVSNLAEVLGLEIEEPARQSVTLSGDPTAASLAQAAQDLQAAAAAIAAAGELQLQNARTLEALLLRGEAALPTPRKAARRAAS